MLTECTECTFYATEIRNPGQQALPLTRHIAYPRDLDNQGVVRIGYPGPMYSTDAQRTHGLPSPHPETHYGLLRTHTSTQDINIEHKDFHSIFKSNKGGKR